jgi:hypothetical protein
MKNEIIVSAKLYGDFFAVEDVGKVEHLIVGCRSNYDEILSTLKNGVKEGVIYSVTLEELAGLAAGK